MSIIKGHWAHNRHCDKHFKYLNISVEALWSILDAERVIFYYDTLHGTNNKLCTLFRQSTRVTMPLLYWLRYTFISEGGTDCLTMYQQHLFCITSDPRSTSPFDQTVMADCKVCCIGMLSHWYCVVWFTWFLIIYILGLVLWTQTLNCNNVCFAHSLWVAKCEVLTRYCTLNII